MFSYLTCLYYHIYIAKCLSPRRDNHFENLRETTVLACKMSCFGFRPWIKNVACLSSQIMAHDGKTDGVTASLLSLNTSVEIILSNLFTKNKRILYYNSFIKPLVRSCRVTWTSCCSHYIINKISKLQKRCARIILDAQKRHSSVDFGEKRTKLLPCRHP